MDIRFFFNQNIEKYNQNIKHLSRKATLFAALRTIVFLGFIVALLVLINFRQMQVAFIIGVIFFPVFGLSVKYHNLIKTRLTNTINLISLNKEELVRTNNDFEGLKEGVEHKSKPHAYVDDLDVFGKNSLYQLINRTSTVLGERLLAQWLLHGVSPNKIPENQKTAKSLASDYNWCLQYRAMGMRGSYSLAEIKAFEEWLDQPLVLQKSKNLQYAKMAMPLAFIVLTGIILITGITWYALLPLAILNAFILSKYWKYASETVDKTIHSLELLKSLSSQISLVHQAAFEDALFKKLAASFHLGGKNAQKEIRNLHNLLDQLESRSNMLHIFINLPFLLDIQWLTRIEKWKLQNATYAKQWFETLACLEALISLTGLHVINPDWTFPHISEAPYLLHSKSLGHPMIQKEQRITNSIHLDGPGKLLVLTGPNMAGKSTFLRTVAINIVMAHIGAPVCADSFTFNPRIKVFTSMRVADNLSESISSFYAELNRIKYLLDMIREGKPAFYFLDELLKGTNSSDRHKGAVALIKQLSALGASGIVSTHDLELGELSSEMSNVENVSFESTIIGNELHFDYKLHQGISKSFNACELMRKMGIDI